VVDPLLTLDSHHSRGRQPGPTVRAIWIHEPEDPTAPPGHMHVRIGCADLV
jgi:hypothetical protein